MSAAPEKPRDDPGRSRILWLSHFVPYPPHGGARIRSYHLIRELAREFDIDLYMLDLRSSDFPGKDPDGERRELSKIVRSVTRLPLRLSSTKAGKAIHVLRSFVSSLPVTTHLFSNRKHREALRRIARDNEYRAVHVDTLDLFAYLPVIGHLPVVLNHHNVESELLSRQADARPGMGGRYVGVQARRLRALESRTCPRVACNITVSDLDAEKLSAQCPDARFEVVLNGVDTDFHRPDPARHAREAQTLVWAGAMHTFVNRDAVEFFLRDVWPILARERENLRLLLIGGHPPELARKTVAADRIETPGYVPDVRPWLARGDIFVVPIRVGGGTRLKILDAFAAGVPLVSTAVGCEGLTVEDGRHLLIADTPREFASAVLRMVDDSALRRRAASEARALVERSYSWNVIGSSFRGIYGSVTTNPDV